jgi:hypothetical protein
MTHYIHLFLSLEEVKVAVCAHIIRYMLQIHEEINKYNICIYSHQLYFKILNKRDIVLVSSLKSHIN